MSFSKIFGKEAQVPSPLTLSSTGKRMVCHRANFSPTGSSKWFALKGKGISFETISFCEHCAKYFREDELEEVSKEENPKYFGEFATWTLKCDMSYNGLLYGRHNINVRGLYISGFNVNVNIPHGDDFYPIGTIPTDVAKHVAKSGLLMVPIPLSITKFEISISADLVGNPMSLNRQQCADIARRDLYYQIEGHSGIANKKIVKIIGNDGNTGNYYRFNEKKSLIIDSWDRNECFVYHSPSRLEKENGLFDEESNDDSNKFFFKITLFKRVVYTEPEIIYRNSGSVMRDGGASMTRGGGGANMTRGGGGERLTRGMSDYSGGSTLSIEGETTHSQVNYTRDRFVKVTDIPPIEFAIQLLCDQSEEEKIHLAKVVQAQVERDQSRPKTRAELFGSSTISHATQANLMWNPSYPYTGNRGAVA